MIKNLSGEFETVEYENKRFVMLYDNNEIENYPTHWHNAVEIIMPIVGSFNVRTGADEYHLRERDILIIPPGELHTLPPQEGRRIIFQCNNTVLANVPALDAVMPVFRAPMLIQPEQERNLYMLAKKQILDIYSEYYENSDISDIRIYINLISLLVAVREYQLDLEQKSYEGSADTLRKYSETIKHVLKYIDQNYMNEITLEKLAAIAGYSKYHFSRIFNQYQSMSYIQYINLRRTRAAEMLLLDPSIPITEVAMRAGFSSLSTFNRIFKEIKHCTPSSYQRFYCSTGELPIAE
jgi:AraC-like DNA-binding protein